MKENPSVCAIMLLNGREPMVKRAIKSFREQTYENKKLFFLNTGVECDSTRQDGGIWGEWIPDMAGKTVGELRNIANEYANQKCLNCDLIAHWDSDDWSHPRRIEEQVALLETSGKECVGYSDMLFWDETPGKFCGAWLWNNLDKRGPIGTSLMYKRSAWERVPFLALPNKAGATGEEYNWLKQVDALGVCSFGSEIRLPGDDYFPRMIASIHGGNTQYYDPAEYVAHNRGTSWRRAAEYDDYCRKVMAL